VFSSLFGVPTPVFGLVAFVTIAALACLRGAWARRVLVGVAAVGALVAVLLLTVQALAGVWCKFCVVADVSACALFGVAVWRLLAGWDPPEARLPRAALALTIAPALVFPIGIGSLKKPILPEPIARELAQTPNGAVTVIDFADFECPFCRMTHAILSPLLAEHRDKVRVVRKNVPLPMHPHAFDAARAACCGEQMGKGEAMADALFSAPVEELTPEGCAKVAASLGLDEGAFRECTKSPATDARIHADQATFKASQGHGLPTLWIGDEKIEGYRPDDTLEKTLEREIGKRG
jgi:predicted DsbA family dithiol-disulfide isomerase